eukprot:TRINITY_DN3395_c0_g1_i2.p1 TRINITY_DN3395_c0_g1~~TRINITY_DN3395_c0_g1_i2.p1  ORF type:complete len:353 (+),score=57.45 TRINITY_DN3395_c0_g1_i2:326-1384(+)
MIHFGIVKKCNKKEKKGNKGVYFINYSFSIPFLLFLRMGQTTSKGGFLSTIKERRASPYDYTKFREVIFKIGSKDQFLFPTFLTISSNNTSSSSSTEGGGVEEGSNRYDDALFVVDSNHNRIVVLDKITSDVISVVGEDRLHFPSGVLVFQNESDPLRRKLLVVSDRKNRLLVFDLIARSYLYQLTHSDYFKLPIGLCSIPHTNYVVVANLFSNCVTIHSLPNEPRDVVDEVFKVIGEPNRSGKEDGLFDGPSNVTVNSKGHILVSDFNNERIQVFDSLQNDCTFLRKISGSGLKSPSGIVVDSLDNIFAVDSHKNNIFVFSEFGDLLHSFPGGKELDMSKGIAFDPQNCTL